MYLAAQPSPADVSGAAPQLWSRLRSSMALLSERAVHGAALAVVFVAARLFGNLSESESGELEAAQDMLNW